jgi:hypothetical protein
MGVEQGSRRQAQHDKAHVATIVVFVHLERPASLVGPSAGFTLLYLQTNLVD